MESSVRPQLADSDYVPTEGFYDYSAKSVSSLYDEEGASSYYTTVETAAIRLALGLPGSYTSSYDSNTREEGSIAGSCGSEYSDVPDSASDTESSDPPPTKSDPQPKSSSSINMDEVLSSVPTSIKELKRSANSSSTSANIGYKDIYVGNTSTLIYQLLNFVFLVAAQGLLSSCLTNFLAL